MRGILFSTPSTRCCRTSPVELCPGARFFGPVELCPGAIEKKTISNPADIIYKTIIFLQLWGIKFKSREKEKLSWMVRELRELYVILKPAAT
jgi:hypothetical protein